MLMQHDAERGLSMCDSLHFASYLIAARQLTFVITIPYEVDGKGMTKKNVFVFRDPDNQLPDLYEQYAAGAVVPAIDYPPALRMLRREMGGVA